MYISVDGDDIGKDLELHIIKNDLKGAEIYSQKIDLAFNYLVNAVKKTWGAEISFFGGDNFIFFINNEDLEMNFFKEICNNFFELSGKTISVGIGNTPRESYLSLKFAKLSGKNQIRRYGELN